MATVKIHVRGSSEPIEVEASAEDEAFYDNLPYTSGNVTCTEISS